MNNSIEEQANRVFINIHLSKLNTKLERQKQAVNSTQLEIEYWQGRAKQLDLPIKK